MFDYSHNNKINGILVSQLVGYLNFHVIGDVSISFPLSPM